MRQLLTARTADGRTIRMIFHAIAGTRMMCPEPVMATESRFLAALARAKAVELRADRLGLVYLAGDGRTSTLEFKTSAMRPE